MLDWIIRVLNVENLKGWMEFGMDSPSSSSLLGQPRRLKPFYKEGNSKSTIDRFLEPVGKTGQGQGQGQGQNDIRNYFLPVARSKVGSNGEVATSSPLRQIGASAGSSHDGHGAIRDQTSGASQSVEVRQPHGKAPAAPPVRPSMTHKHANSAVLPRFDPFFDVDKDFPHSTSRMAPRVTDVVRRSLVPRPLNIRLPPPPPYPHPAAAAAVVETSPSPSETTSSPSTVADSDTAPGDGEQGRRDAPSFKLTYSSVRSRQNTDEEGPISPLVALRESSAGPWLKRVERPGALRSKTVPQMGEPGWRDSVIYFLPKMSPTEDWSGDEGMALEDGGYPTLGEQAEGERVDVRVEDDCLRRDEKEREGTRHKDMTVSPGMGHCIPF